MQPRYPQALSPEQVCQLLPSFPVLTAKQGSPSCPAWGQGLPACPHGKFHTDLDSIMKNGVCHSATTLRQCLGLGGTSEGTRWVSTSPSGSPSVLPVSCCLRYGTAGPRERLGCSVPRLSNPHTAGCCLESAKKSPVGNSPSPPPMPTFVFCFRNTTEKKLQKGHLINLISMPNLFYHRHQISSEGLEEKNNAALKPGKTFLLEGCTGAPYP